MATKKKAAAKKKPAAATNTATTNSLLQRAGAIASAPNSPAGTFNELHEFLLQHPDAAELQKVAAIVYSGHSYSEKAELVRQHVNSVLNP